MTEPLRILVAEDSETDAELVQRELKRGGLDFQSRRVQTEPDFRRELDEFRPDLVISDFSMPQFSGPKALAIARESRADIPFIFISGTIGENVAVDMMKAGADDYVMKNNLARLVPALKRELREAEVRRARRLAEEGLRDSESRFRQLIEQASDGIFVTDKEGNFILVNSRYCEMLGYMRAELLQLHSEVTYPEGEREKRAQHRAEVRERKTSLYERIIRRRDGSSFPAEVNITLLDNDNVQGIVRDITERKRAQQALVESEAGLRRAQIMAKIAHVVTGPDGSFERWSDTLPQLIGVEPAQMPRSTREWLDLLHPDDRARFRATAIEAARTGTRMDVEYRLRRADGAWTRVLQVIEPLQSQADAEGGTRWFSTLRDVTEQRLAEEKIKRLTRIYAVLSGINALIVRVRDRDELFREACRIAAEAGEFKLAWLGVVDREAARVEPVAWHGVEQDYIRLMPLGLNESVPEQYGLAGRAVRERRAMIVEDMTEDPRVSLHKEALERGFHSLVVLPLLMSEEVVGVLALYATEVGIFDEEEMKLLLELSGDISFALEHIEKEEKLNYLAYYDSLTGLANRDLLHERLTQSVHAAGRDQRKLALIVMDIERFRAINDSFGRQAGDELLKQFAAGLVRVVGDATRLGRVSGDHFAVVLSSLKVEDEAARFYEERLREYFTHPLRIESRELRISAKAGIAIFPNDGSDADTLFRNAEAALKKAKASGERYLFYTQQMTERIGEKLALENNLRQALEKDEFVLHYQPKVDTVTRRIESVEALIRWQSPELGLVPPMQFIPLLEETGLILEVGAWALRRAVRDHRTWKERDGPAPRIAVNVSPIQLRKRDFVASIEEAMRHGSVPPGIDLEITESLVMEDIEANMKKLEAVRVLGASIAIDDFGTGYSSLGYLAKLPVHSLKIDRSFIITMLKDPAIMTLVSTIISMAHSLRLKVVAEGVDAEEQAKALDRLGCDQLQGYLFSKPLPFDDMTALLGSRT